MIYRVRPFGDSITAGYGFGTGCPSPNPPKPPPIQCWPPSPDGGGYRGYLLADPPNKVPFVMVGRRSDNSAIWIWENRQQNHDGYGGYGIEQLYTVAQQPPEADVILVHAGTNDIDSGNATGEQTAARLKQLLINLLTTDQRAKVLVAQIVPNFKPGKNAIVMDYNKRIPGVIDTFKSWLRTLKVVDLNTGMTVGDMLPDGVHPNPSGYKKMATGWKNAINALPPFEFSDLSGENGVPQV